MINEWWFAIDQNREGPVSLDALRKMRSDGILSESSLVWMDGMPTWLPFSEVPDLHQSSPSASSTRRAIARFIDWQAMSMLVAFPIGFALALRGPGFASWMQEPGSEYLFSWLVTPLGLLAEAVVFGLFGTTLGKGLLAITVTTFDGRRPTFLEYLQRQLDVWVSAGSFIPCLYLFFALAWESRLRKVGQASYDENKFNVTAPKLGFLRGVAVAAVLFAFLCAYALLNNGAK